MTPKQRTEAEKILLEYGQAITKDFPGLPLWHSRSNKYVDEALNAALASLENFFNGGGEKLYSQAELDRALEEAKQQRYALHASDLARAVGLLEGLGYPDEYLERHLKHVESQLRTTPPDERKDV